MFVKEKQYVFCNVESKCLNIIYTNLGLKGVTLSVSNFKIAPV